MRGRRLIESVRKLEEESHDPRLRGLMLMSEGAADYWVCKLARAEQLVREAERVFREETTGTHTELKSARMFLMFTLRHRGSWAQMRELREQYVEDGERRGDQYVVTSLNRYCSSLWLAAGKPTAAREMLAAAKWILPTIAFHTQHWYELDARGELALYDHTVEADIAEIDALFGGLERSVLQRVTTVRALACWLRGRLALARGNASEARRAIGKLAKVDNPRAAMFISLLEAGIAGRVRDGQAVARLREAATLAKHLDMSMHAAAARYQLGTLLGGSEGAEHITAAEQLMRGEGVLHPDRFAHLYVPGLER